MTHSHNAHTINRSRVNCVAAFRCCWMAGEFNETQLSKLAGSGKIGVGLYLIPHHHERCDVFCAMPPHGGCKIVRSVSVFENSSSALANMRCLRSVTRTRRAISDEYANSLTAQQYDDDDDSYANLFACTRARSLLRKCKHKFICLRMGREERVYVFECICVLLDRLLLRYCCGWCGCCVAAAVAGGG